MLLFFSFLACGPCPTGEILCDEQCVPESTTAAELSADIFSKSCAFSACHSSAASASAGYRRPGVRALQPSAGYRSPLAWALQPSPGVPHQRHSVGMTQWIGTLMDWRPQKAPVDWRL